jgi:ferredoxin
MAVVPTLGSDRSTPGRAMLCTAATDASAVAPTASTTPRASVSRLKYRLDAMARSNSASTGVAACRKASTSTPTKCTGCLQCEMACSYENYGVFAPAKSRIKVFDFHTPGARCPTPARSATRPGACTPARWRPSRWTRHRRQGGQRVHLRGLQGLHHQLPVRHHQLRAGNRQGAEVRPVRRRPRLRHACPTGAITYVDANWTGLNKMPPGPTSWATKPRPA